MVDRSRRRLWIINGALIVLVLVVLGGVIAGLTASSSAGADTSRRTVPVGRGTVTETVTASGTVASAETSTLNFAAGGTVASVSVGLGDRVRRGQRLATLDGDSARANLTAARAQLTAARQQLSDAIDARDAAKDPTPAPAAGATAATPAPAASGSGTSGSQGAQGTGTSGAGASGSAGSDASVDSARASVRQAEAQVVTSQQSTSDLTLEAPQDGTVVTLDARVGQTVGGGGIVTTGGSAATGGSSGGSAAASGGAASGGAASGGAAAGGSSAASTSGAAGAAGASSGSPLMTVADLDSLEVQADVPELDVGRVNNGLPATITVNALPGDSIPGAVSSVDVLPGAATGTGSSVQYGTTVGVTSPPPGLRPGMSASVSIVVRSATDTTFLPSVAVTPIGGAGATSGMVSVLGRDGQVSTRTIGIGLTSDSTTQVTSGLAPGELAVLPDAAAVDPNQFRGGPRTQQQSTGR